MGCTCDDIRNIIREELENMTISITNTNTNCCCGACGGGCSGATTPPIASPPPPGVDNPPQPPIPPDNDTPPPDVTEDVEYRQFSCNMAHYMYFLVRSAVIESMASWDRNRFLSVGAFIPMREDAGQFVRPGGAQEAAWSYWEWLLVVWSNDDMLDLLRQMDLRYNEFVCALSGTFTASLRRERFLTVLEQMPINENQKRWVRLMVSGIEFHSWFNPSDFAQVQESLPASYQDRDCPCQGAGLPTSDDYHYELIPFEYSVTAETSEPTTYVTRDELIGDGFAAGAVLLRTDTYPNAFMRVYCDGVSKADLAAQYGVNGYAFMGYLVDVGAVTWLPTTPACAVTIAASDSTLLPGTSPFAANTANFISIPDVSATEVSDYYESLGHEVQRKADVNFLILENTPPTLILTIGTVSQEYITYNVAYRIVSGYVVVKVFDE